MCMEVKASLPLLPLRDIVVFPSMVIPLFVGRDKSITALNEVMKKDKKIILVTQKNSEIDDPKKDKLLLEIISYVLDRGHYDPKDFNDEFSENVFSNYLENIDGQHRFFLNSDIKSFESYRFKIDDELKTNEINFFTLTYSRLMQRMKQVESFYKELLEKPFNFSIKEEIERSKKLFKNSPL